MIRVTYPIVRATYPDKEVREIHHYSEEEFTTVKGNSLQWKEFTTPVKEIHYSERNSLRQWRKFTTVKGIHHTSEGGRRAQGLMG